MEKNQKMRIERIKITKLFGEFDYDLDLKNEKNITVIYGLNGTGKTTIFKIIKYLFEMKLDLLKTLKFQKIEIWTKKQEADILISFKKNKEGWFISYNSDGKEINHIIDYGINIRKIKKSIRLLKKKKNEIPSIINDVDFVKLLTDMLNMAISLIPELVPYLKNRIFDEESKIECTKEEYKKIEKQIEKKKNIKYFFTKITQLCIVQFFPAQRIRLSKKSFIDIFEQAQPYITADIEDVNEELLDENDELMSDYHDVNEGDIIEPKGTFMLSFDEIMDEAMKNEVVYLGRKIHKQEKIKIDEFILIYNSIYYNGMKEIRLDNDGKCFLFNKSDKKIPYNRLSSGELNLFLIYYKLCFDTGPQSIVLIDEPEISCHIRWQMDFLENVERLQKLNNFQCIIATHSPYVLKNNIEMAIDLNKFQSDTLEQ